MEDLTAFLRTRLDEDEAEARETADTDAEFWADVRGDGTYFARHDPARVLREVEAKRVILARYDDTLARQEDPDYSAVEARDQAREYEDFVLPNLAAIYSDHPDYDPEWKP